MFKEERIHTNNFLDVWYERSPDTYMTAHELYGGVGVEMILWLKDTDKDLYANICKETLATVRF